MATGVITLTSETGRFNHQLCGDLSALAYQLPAIGDWLDWCRRFHVKLSADSLLSFAYQSESHVLHRLSGCAPVFGQNAAEGMREYYGPLVATRLPHVVDMYHVDVIGGRFNSLTVLRRVDGLWDARVFPTVSSVHAGAVRASLDAARAARSEGYSAWQVDPEGTAQDFEEVASRHAAFAAS